MHNPLRYLRESFQHVRTIPLSDEVRNRTPLPGSDPAGGNAKSYVDHYVGFDTINEDAFIMRYPALASGVDSQFAVSIDQNGSLWGTLGRRLREQVEDEADDTPFYDRSVQCDGVVSTELRKAIPTGIATPLFLREEVRNLYRTDCFVPRAVLYTETRQQIPDEAFFVIPLHGRTLADVSLPVVEALIHREDIARCPVGDPDTNAYRIFARNICYDVWFNLRALSQQEIIHFDFKPNNFFIRMDSVQGLSSGHASALSARCYASQQLVSPNEHQPCAFVLGDYGHSVYMGQARSLRARVETRTTFDTTVSKSFLKSVLGTAEMAHPDVYTNNGKLFSESRPELNFPLSHHLDRFSAGLMLVKLFQGFIFTEHERMTYGRRIFDTHLVFTNDYGLPPQELRSHDPEKVEKQIYQSNVDVFRAVINGRPIAGPVAKTYAQNWKKCLFALNTFDPSIYQMIGDFLRLPEVVGQRLDENDINFSMDAPYEGAAPSAQERAIFLQCINSVGCFDAPMQSHIDSLIARRKALFAQAHTYRQRAAGKTVR